MTTRAEYLKRLKNKKMLTFFSADEKQPKKNSNDNKYTTGTGDSSPESTNSSKSNDFAGSTASQSLMQIAPTIATQMAEVIKVPLI